MAQNLDFAIAEIAVTQMFGEPSGDLADAIKWCVANSAGKPYGFAIVEKDAGGNWRAVKHVSNGIVSDTAP